MTSSAAGKSAGSSPKRPAGNRAGTAKPSVPAGSDAAPQRLSRKSENTRNRLLKAARAVFERVGFFDTRVADIVAEAGVSHGSFYTHFTDKTDAFKAIVLQSNDELNQEMLTIPAELAHDLKGALDYSNRQFFQMFQRHAALHRAIAEANVVDAGFRDLRVTAREEHIRQVAHTIERWQARGQADSTLDPRHTAAALVCMMAEFAFVAFAWERDYDIEEMTRTTTTMWLRTVAGPQAQPTESR